MLRPTHKKDTMGGECANATEETTIKTHVSRFRSEAYLPDAPRTLFPAYPSTVERTAAEGELPRT